MRRLKWAKRWHETIPQIAIDRFLKHVCKSGTLSSDRAERCWHWKARCDRYGYPTFKYNKRTRQANRFSYVAFIGGISAGYDVHHKCSNKLC